MFFVLHKLNLTAEQKTQIKCIMASQKSQFEALRTSSKANREALATTPPTDAGYPALIETAKSNAATGIKLRSETWSAIYRTCSPKRSSRRFRGSWRRLKRAPGAEAGTAPHPPAGAPSAD